MKNFSLFLLALVICFILANAMVNDSGYVLVAYENMTFESSLWGALLLIIATLGGIWLSIGLLQIFTDISTFIYPWSSTARQSRARRLSTRGLTEFTLGHWKKAEKLLAQAAEDGESPLTNYLAAARAAHESGNTEAISKYLRHADRSTLGADIAVGITKAQLQLSGGQLEQALATLTHLYKKAPSHPYILKLLKQAYVRLNDWQGVAKLLPRLKKYKVIDTKKYHEIEKQTIEALFEQAYKQGRSQNHLEQRIKPVIKVWKNLSSQQRRDPLSLLHYSSSLVMLGAGDKAEHLLRENLIAHYCTPLIKLYGKIQGKDNHNQLLTAEALLSERPNDPELLLTLGRLAMRNELWGKALEYFETSLNLRKGVDVYNELGKLLAHMNDHKKSSHYFHEGLKLVADDTSVELAVQCA
ncbi:MAG: heme biosynthesis HemY N-terminal domain-containing protein [Candidatus Endonucleobacter bathymodioli]|uniref:Heme biosynthesis HemY N-terminal domain-containing protein n=1 Tax=Candidatus Endonucleibacter bathymodioli TaxID=539814 RepID=A0AA90STT1_9GAMM|nr:heme biosynthesis HemY N-terminal domain-containing protein [Candidatus Endonucleobacter bathymodioli]